MFGYQVVPVSSFVFATCVRIATLIQVRGGMGRDIARRTGDVHEVVLDPTLEDVGPDAQGMSGVGPNVPGTQRGTQRTGHAEYRYGVVGRGIARRTGDAHEVVLDPTLDDVGPNAQGTSAWDPTYQAREVWDPKYRAHQVLLVGVAQAGLDVCVSGYGYGFETSAVGLWIMIEYQKPSGLLTQPEIPQ
ncbi:hypothetical protein LXL04_013524 [Taraxacum kok-saghyz]